MQETPPPEDVQPKSRPPYLFLIPVALGIFGFIGYQTVRMGMDSHVVVRSPYAIDTSVAQAVVSHGVITVHAADLGRRKPQRIAVAKPAEKASPKPTDSPTPQPSTSPTAPGKETPSPKPAATKPPAKKLVAKPVHLQHHVTATNDDGDNAIAQEPVPHIRPVARPIANVNVSREQPSNSDATTPPITDAPSVRKDVQPPEAKAFVVAEAPKPEVQSTVNAVDRVVEAKMTYAASPDYPEIARDQGVRGTSVVYVTVDPSGGIVHISIASSSGNSVLDRSAVTAARSSRYVPPKVDGKPAIETYRVTYDFAP